MRIMTESENDVGESFTSAPQRASDDHRYKIEFDRAND